MGVQDHTVLLYFTVTQNVLSQLYSLKIQDAERVETSQVIQLLIGISSIRTQACLTQLYTSVYSANLKRMKKNL